MADVPFISGAGGRLRMKVPTVSQTLMVPCSGVTYRKVRNNRIMKLIDGGTPHPKNKMQGIQATVLQVSTFLYPATGSTGWFSGDIVAAMLALSVNNDLPFIDVKVESGADTATDQMKLASLQLTANGASNVVACNMAFLGLVRASVATFGSYVADTDSPLLFEDMVLDFTPSGGSIFSVNEVENFTFAMGTGVSPVKYSGDGVSGPYPSHIDSGTFGASATFAQRAGAQYRMDAYDTGELICAFDNGGASEQFHVGLDRLDQNVLPNPGGNVGAPVSFQYDGSSAEIAWETA